MPKLKALAALLLVALSLVALSLACNNEEKSASGAPSASAPPAGPVIPPDVDKQLLGELEEAADKCKVTPGTGSVACSRGEKSKLVSSFNRGQRERVQALPTFVHALRSSDPKLQTVAASVLYAAFRVNLGPTLKVGAVKANTAKDLIDAVDELPRTQAMQSAPAAVHAAMLSEQSPALFKVLTADKPVQVLTMAYKYLMVYGRLGVFEKVKELGKNPGAAIVLSAIEAPRNMRDWTPEEQAAICPWAQSFLADPRAPVSGNAAAVLSNCGGEHLDALLDEVDQALEDKKFALLHVTALRNVCGPSQAKRGGAADEKQCARIRKQLETAVESKGLEGRVRAMALSSLAYQWADEQTVTFSKKFAKASEPELARAADQTIKRLEPRLERAKQKPEP